MTKAPKNADTLIFAMIIILALIGIIMIYSASYYVSITRFNRSMFHFTMQQSFAVILGIGFMWIASKVDYRMLKPLVPFGYALSVALLLATRLFMPARNGVYRWFEIGPISFQPSEFAKVMVILMLACYLSNRKHVIDSRIHELKGLLASILIIAVPAGLVFWGRNLSTTIIVVVIGFVVIFVSSKYFWRYLVLAGSLAAGMGAYLIHAVSTGHYQGDRIIAWQDPFAHSSTIGFQTIQSLYAVASGGWFGLGLGQSNQKLMFMPEPYNDFIFAIICEELGFFGALIVLTLFGVLIWRGILVAMKAPDIFGMLIATGAMVLISVQVAINVGVVTNTIPNTGIPMPFISYGGTSVVFVLVLMGIVLNISRNISKE
jgi:cell division protein FtsW